MAVSDLGDRLRRLLAERPRAEDIPLIEPRPTRANHRDTTTHHAKGCT